MKRLISQSSDLKIETGPIVDLDQLHPFRGLNSYRGKGVKIHLQTGLTGVSTEDPELTLRFVTDVNTENKPPIICE